MGPFPGLGLGGTRLLVAMTLQGGDGREGWPLPGLVALVDSAVPSIAKRQRSRSATYKTFLQWLQQFTNQ